MNRRIYDYLMESSKECLSEIDYVSEDLDNSLTYFALRSLDDDFQESAGDLGLALKDKIKTFFKRIKNAINRFIFSTRRKLQNLNDKIAVKAKAKEGYKTMMDQKARGVATVNCPDLKKAVQVLGKQVKDLERRADKFTKMKYKNMDVLERDVDEFNTRLSEYSRTFGELMNTSYQVPIDVVIKYFRDEINGHGFWSMIYDYQGRLDRCEVACMKMMDDIDTIGSDVLKRHVTFIQEIVNKTSSFITKSITKIVVGIVMIF